MINTIPSKEKIRKLRKPTLVKQKLLNVLEEEFLWKKIGILPEGRTSPRTKGSRLNKRGQGRIILNYTSILFKW